MYGLYNLNIPSKPNFVAVRQYFQFQINFMKQLQNMIGCFQKLWQHNKSKCIDSLQQKVTIFADYFIRTPPLLNWNSVIIAPQNLGGGGTRRVRRENTARLESDLLSSITMEGLQRWASRFLYLYSWKSSLRWMDSS